MSADVWIEYGACQHCGRGEHRDIDLNITYNLSRMLHAAGFDGWREIIGSPAGEVGRHVLDVLDGMREDEDRWRAMNPANGWGDYDKCLQGRMREWAEKCVEFGAGGTIGGWL